MGTIDAVGTASSGARAYQDLNVRTFINAAGTYTALGGSRMPPAVVEAMSAAAQCFVRIDELQARVGERIASLTHNDAAYVTCGAAAGLVIATAACVAGADPARARQLPDLRGMRSQVVIYRSHRNPYDYAVRTLPIQLVEVGFPNEIVPPQPWELEHAIGDQCAAVLYVVGCWATGGALPLEDVVRIAHAKGVPVVVDAAAQLPPKENLWQFTGLGADLVLFSGGKDLRGPQSSGLIVGRRDLIAACRLIGAPHHGIGRPFKVGKEEMIGLLAAVELYVQHDEGARARQAEQVAAMFVEQLDGKGVSVERSFPNEAGQPIARVLIRFAGAHAAPNRDHVVDHLRAGDPSIEVGLAGSDGFYVNPMTLDDGEEIIVLRQLSAALSATKLTC